MEAVGLSRGSREDVKLIPTTRTLDSTTKAEFRALQQKVSSIYRHISFTSLFNTVVALVKLIVLHPIQKKGSDRGWHSSFFNKMSTEPSPIVVFKA
jgi:hypothetical protein